MQIFKLVLNILDRGGITMVRVGTLRGMTSVDTVRVDVFILVLGTVHVSDADSLHSETVGGDLGMHARTRGNGRAPSWRLGLAYAGLLR